MRIGQQLSIPLFLIAIGNLLDCIVMNESIIHIILWSGTFILLSIASFFLKSSEKHKIIVSILLLLISLLTLFLDDPGSLSWIFMFSYSIFISKRDRLSYIVYGGLGLSIVSIRFFIERYESHTMITYLSGIAFVLIIYFNYIHPKPKPEPESIKIDYLKSPVPKDVVDILSLRIQGLSWSEINVKLNLNVTDDRIRRKITEERKRQGFDNQEAFIFYLTDSGVISPVSYNQQNLEKESGLVC